MVETYPAAVLVAPKRLVYEERSLSVPLAPCEVLVEVAYAGVCGTDLAIYSGDYRVPLPLVLGHEFSGVVVDGGSAVRRKRLIGRRVVGEINATCVAWHRRSRCPACRRGLPNHCQRRTVVGIVGHDGAFARYVRLPLGCVHPLPASISLEAGIFVEPLAAALRTFELAPVREGATVVVLGCGRLGRLVALVAAKLGMRVIAVARRRETLLRVQRYAQALVCMGTSSTPPASPAQNQARQRTRPELVEIAGPDQLAMFVLERTRGLGADLVVEATGDPTQWGVAMKLVRPQGTVALKSTPGVPGGQLDSTSIAVDEIRIQGSRCGPFDKAIRFMVAHGEPNSEWTTARFGLDQTVEALEAARREPKVAIRIAGG